MGNDKATLHFKTLHLPSPQPFTPTPITPFTHLRISGNTLHSLTAVVSAVVSAVVVGCSSSPSPSPLFAILVVRCCSPLLFFAVLKKEEFQHTAYATNAYIAMGPLARQILQGKKSVKLEIYTEQSTKGGVRSVKRCLGSSGLELKLDELRKDLSSAHGGILPYSVLSTDQISLLSSQKPNSLEQLEKVIGKLKTEKYGNRILEQIEKYSDFKPTDKQGTDGRAAKRAKTKKNLVLIESSEDEE